MTERLEGSRETQRERCPDCGYTEGDARLHLDHHLCKNAGNAPWEKKKVSTPAAPETPPERSEDFWINACLHILYCQKEWSKKCPVCHRIAEIVTAEKEAVVTGEFLEAGTPRKEEARENR